MGRAAGKTQVGIWDHFRWNRVCSRLLTRIAWDEVSEGNASDVPDNNEGSSTEELIQNSCCALNHT